MKKYLFILSLFLFTVTEISAETLKITFLIGNVDFMDIKKSPSVWKKAWYGLEVTSQMRLRTGVNSRLEITGEKTKFKIGARSVLEIPQNFEENKTLLKIITGKLWTKVSSLLDKEEIKIISLNAVVGVRGTEFVTVCDSDTTTVMVFNGEVDFGTVDGANFIKVPAHKMSVIKNNEPPSQPVDIPFQVYQEWGAEMPVEKSLQLEDLEKQKSENIEEVKTLNLPETNKKRKLSNAEIIEMYQRKKTDSEESKSVINEKTVEPVQQVETLKTNKKQIEKENIEKKEKVSPSFKMNSSIGPVNIDGVNWQQIILMPDFSAGPFGIGLYLPFYFDLNKPFFPNTSWWNYNEWDYNGWTDGIKDTLNKILYLRWGNKKEPVFIKIGSIPDITLGSGFIMYRFSNMLDFPKKRHLGLQFDINTRYGGFETMVEDLFFFDLFGGRIYFKPFFFTSLNILKKLEIGYSHIVDDFPSWFIGFHGVDAITPVFSGSLFNMDLYTGWATCYRNNKKVINSYKGWGFSSGIKGNLSILLFNFEYRMIVNNFVLQYFDVNYQNERLKKFMLLERGFKEVYAKDENVLKGDLGLSFGKYGKFEMTYMSYLNSKDENLLSAELFIEKNVLPLVSGSVRFEKRDIVSFFDLYKNFFDERTLLTAEGILSADPKVDIAFLLKRVWLREPDGSYKPLTTYSIETRFAFF